MKKDKILIVGAGISGLCTIRAKSYIIEQIAQSPSPLFCTLSNVFYRLLPSRLITEDTLKTFAAIS